MIAKRKSAIILIMILCMIALLGLTSCKKDSAETAEPLPFISSNEIVIAHITDTHYYPLNYCYNGNVADTSYEAQIRTGKKLVAESSAFNVQALEEIVAQNPDYLLVTGDLTSDGEIQAHIEMSNLLRQLQNKIRENGKTSFQVFVTIGNHDVYNLSAKHYRNSGMNTRCEHLTTRYDITKLYSSLGYPDLSNEEIEAYYATLNDIFYDDLPYDGIFINSTTANNVNIEYQYIDTDKLGNLDYENGEISYIAYCPNDYVVLAIDEEISDAVVHHYGGGLFYDNTKDYILSKQSEDKFQDKSLLGIMHHNVVPHFESEDTLLKDFTIYGWKETTDFFADLGIRYMFTGHMHSNDIATHSSFNGNIINDIETSSTISYKGGTRYCKLEKGTVGDDYAENFSTWIDLVDATDFSKLFDEGYLNLDYIGEFKLSQFMTQSDGKYICLDPSEYAVTRVFANVVGSMIAGYLSPDYITNLGELAAGKLTKSNNFIVKRLGDYATKIINNILVHIEDVVLVDYNYYGDNQLYSSDEQGAKLCGYLDDLVNKVLNTKVNTKGDTLIDFALGSYLKHMGGLDTSLNDATPDDLEALANFKNGTIVRELLLVLLDKQTGLYPLLEGLTQPMDLAKGMTDTEASGLAAIFKLFTEKDIKVDEHAIVLDDYIQKILSLLSGMDIISLDMGGATIQEYLDNTLDSFITDSFYTSLGEIAHKVLFEFSMDETSKFENNFDEYALYKYDSKLPATYLSTAPKEPPSIKNGKLPSMLTVSFGENPKTDKNIVWFTDRRIENTDIQFNKGTFDASNATKQSGEYAMYATTTSNIDVGIFATFMHIEIGYHCIELTGLEAGTIYSYRVGSEKDNYWSEVFTFSTAPDDNAKFELLLMTDIQGSALTTYEQSAQIMEKVEKVFKNGYDFVINCGDMVDNSKNLVQWEYFLNTLQPYWGNTTQVVAAGNHDNYAYEAVSASDREYSLTLPGAVSDEYNYYLLHYKVNYPEQEDSTGAYYSFDYSGVHFTVLNTNEMSQKQINWLIDDLTNTQKEFKVIIMHKGLYTAGAHSKDSDIVKMRTQLTPIFAEKGVNLVLQGHDHTYSESYYLDSDGNPIETKATGKSKIGDEGTLYITLGTIGDKFYNYVENENVPIEFGQALHNPTLSNPTFGKLVYDGKNLYYYGYEYDLENDRITKLRGLLWWHYMIMGIGAALVLSSITVTIIFIRKKKIKE